jgi:hypothetical protein
MNISRKIKVFTALFTAIWLLGCQDGKDDFKETITDLAYYRNIGAQIPTEVGFEWVDAYRSRNGLSARLVSSGYSVGKAELQAMLSSVSGLTGVTFHHGLDDAGLHHFILIPLDETLSLWTSASDRILLDANTNSQISAEVAQAWAMNYQQQNPGGVLFHFFGKNIFDEILDISYLQKLEIEPGLNVLNLTPELLLIVNNLDSLLSLGRTSSDDTMVFDASSPCPPCPMMD